MAKFADCYTELLSRPEAAAYLGLKVSTLATWASTHRYGLPFIKCGRLVRYRRTDLDVWLRGRTVNAPHNN